MTIILFADGFEEIEAFTPLDLLRRAGIDIKSAGIGNKNITGSHLMRFETDLEISEISEVPDNIIIPGGMPGSANIASSEKACEMIKAVYAKGGIVAAICAAPAVVLVPLGILDGKKAVCYPGRESDFLNTIHIDQDVVTDKNIITSKAAGTAIDFSLEIIRKIKGEGTSETVAEKICK